MARKKVELFVDINNEKEFEHALERYKDQFICAEIYTACFGFCNGMDNVFTKFKFDWGGGNVILLRVIADEVQALSRLLNQSEPFYMFIIDKKVTAVFRGVNPIKFEAKCRKELAAYSAEKQSGCLRPRYEIDEPTPDEMDWINALAAEMELEQKSHTDRRADRQAMRKQHRAELMTDHLKSVNFVLYWPHAKHAHPELYEKWNDNNLMMVGREELTLTEEKARDVLYSGDAPINEASMHALLAGPALAICLRCLDPVDIVALVRKILYEVDISDNEEQTTAISPFDQYMTYSFTREQIIQQRREERLERIDQTRVKRARILSEIKRIAFDKREAAIEEKKSARQQLKMDLLKAGKLDEMDQLNAEPDDSEDVDIEIPEKLSDVSEEESEVEDDPDEYIPPPGLPIPGFYSPPNDIAKANGLAILFPNIVKEYTNPTVEFIPAHVLVMLSIYKRHKAIEHMTPYKYGILHMGVFIGNDPYKMKHVTYSVKQYDALDIEQSKMDEHKLCFMVSTKVDVPLLELMDFNPVYVSRDEVAGEEECARMFSVDYGDDYPEFEDFDPKDEENDDDEIEDI